MKSFEDTPFADYKTAPSIHRNDGRLQEGVLRIYSGNEIVANGKYNLTKGDFLNSARNALSCELHLNEPVGSKEEGEVTFTGGISIVSKEICCKLGRLTVTRAGKMSRAILTETAKNIVLQKSDLKKTTGDGLPSFYREMPLE